MTTHGNPYKVATTGIHVSVRKPWLAASPDGLVDDLSEPPDQRHGLLEIKCPYSARMLKPSAACTELNRFCCTLVNGTSALKRNHDYHYQIQEHYILLEDPGVTYTYGPHLKHLWNA